MCSILGYYNTDLGFDEISQLNKMLSHRGPDNSQVTSYYFNEKELFLAHNRLSIQDLAVNANQPMENDKYVIVFNGEIYNHLEIRKNLAFDNFLTHSDTETLLYAFEEWGIEKTISSLIGMFAIGLFDKLENKLFLIRDRVGIKPLYWSLQDDEFVFSSELKGFHSSKLSKINHKSLIQFMTLGYIPYDRSYYQDINKLPPAHYLVFNGEKIEIKRYWNLPNKTIDIDYNEAVEETERLIRSSVKYRLLSDLEVGSFLSGGIDSSLISTIMQQESNKQIKTFSIGFDDSRYDESSYAKSMANFLHTDHYEYKFQAKDVINLLDSFDRFYDEPFGDASALPMMLLSKMTKEKVSVALSGDGGDELFLGYDRYFLTNKYYSLFNKVPKGIRNLGALACQYSTIDKLEKVSYPLKYPSEANIYSLLYSSIKPWELRSFFKQEFLEDIYKSEKQELFTILKYKFDNKELIQDLSSLDFNRYLPDDILTKVDRATMAYSLEARVPLLDHRVVEFAYSVPKNIKLKNGPKSILKSILNKHVPKELIDRPKKGFGVPLQYWFRKELKNILYDKINTLDSNIYNVDYINKLYSEHVYNNKNYEYILWNILRLR